MTQRNFTKLVKKHKGWMEGDMARFPSVWHKEQFEAELVGNQVAQQPHPLMER